MLKHSTGNKFSKLITNIKQDLNDFNKRIKTVDTKL